MLELKLPVKMFCHKIHYSQVIQSGSLIIMTVLESISVPINLFLISNKCHYMSILNFS